MAGWNKDFMPAPFPKTDGEREVAARKYNLLPSEYKVNPDDGFGFGDYPKIEGGLGVEARDPYYPYDFPELKRNFGEPVSIGNRLIDNILFLVSIFYWFLLFFSAGFDLVEY